MESSSNFDSADLFRRAWEIDFEESRAKLYTEMMIASMREVLLRDEFKSIAEKANSVIDSEKDKAYEYALNYVRSIDSLSRLMKEAGPKIDLLERMQRGIAALSKEIQSNP